MWGGISLWFKFAFPWCLMILSIFQVIRLYVFFRSVYSYLQHILNWVACFLIVNFITGLYTLDIISLSFLSFANTFTHSVSCPFILLIFFCHAKCSRLIRSHLFIFAFVSVALGEGYQKYNTIFMSKIVLCFLLRVL